MTPRLVPALAALTALNLMAAAVLLTRGETSTGLASAARAAEVGGASPQAEPPKGTAASRRTELTEAARKVSPAIVSVGANTKGYVLGAGNPFFADFAPVYEYRKKLPYMGSGVIVDGKGLVVTNHHVVEGQTDVFVTLTDGREFPGKVLDADTALDVALIKLQGDPKNLPTVRLGDSDTMLVGEWVMAMGNPFGNMIGDPVPTVTAGVVSALRRSFRPNGNMQRAYLDMIQTDAAINPGNSGGALVNSDGELVGINTFIMSRSGGAEGIGFAIPVNRVKTVVEEILLHGRVRSRMIDVQIRNLEPQDARLLETKASAGAVVTGVARGGPAAAAGLMEGDVITGLDGRPVKGAQEFFLAAWTQPVGTKLTLEVDRAGKSRKLEYVMTEAAR